jgi:DNA-binding MarR family transcriptional regulator
VAKRDGSAARARHDDQDAAAQGASAQGASAQSASAQREPRANAHKKPTTLQAVDGDVSMPLDFDRLIHERLRLAIVSSLAVHTSLTFNELKAMLDTSDGNVSVHARKLEDAGYISCTKGYEGRVPRTEYTLTAEGRRALEHYLSHMEALIKRVCGQ